MTTAVLTPESRSSLIELGNGRWKKQILPAGTITYKGRKITFDRDYFSGLIKSFKQQACGPVPFQLADAKNTHTNDPERRRGTVVDLEEASDGLYAVVELDEDGEKLVKQYPDLGVSARIYENFERSDGNFFKAALQHVLGTLDPHVSGMHPWQAVALSNEDYESVIDLSDSQFDDGKEEQKTVVTKTSLKEILAKLRESNDEAELTDAELDQLLAITDAVSATEAPEKLESEDLTDEELDALIAAAEAEESASSGTEDSAETEETPEDSDDNGEEEEEVPVADPQLIAASQRHQEALELANTKIDRQALELAAMRARIAAQDFEAEKRTLATEYGIPPRITDLARPLLESGDEGLVVQLANGDDVDASSVMRNVLLEFGRTLKALDLSDLIGNGEPEPTDSEAEERKRSADETRQWVDQMKSNYSF